MFNKFIFSEALFDCSMFAIGQPYLSEKRDLFLRLMPLPFNIVIQVYNQCIFSEALFDCSKFAIDKVCLGAKSDLFLRLMSLSCITLVPRSGEGHC